MMYMYRRNQGSPNIIKLPSYNQAASAMQWWILFAQWMAFYKMSEEEAIHAFPFHLDDIPRQWFFALEESVKSNLPWLKNAFLKRFSVQKSNFDVNLFQIKQNPDETTENYLARVYQTTSEYDIPKYLLIDMTVQGLKSEVRKIVMLKDLRP